MNVRIRDPETLLTPRQRLAVDRQLRMALGRRAVQVAIARVTIRRRQHASGDDAIACRITAQLHRRGRVEIDDRGASLEEATAAAIWRITHRLERVHLLSQTRVEPHHEVDRKRA